MPSNPQQQRSGPAVHECADVESILAWFDSHGRDLPWRGTVTPWAVLVSEIMLQQTPVARVLPRWRQWMERWPTPAALAAASPADVLTAWDSLGYPRRALRLQECARQIVARHDGQVPSDEAELLALPGIGSYTAGAVLSFAFGQRAVVLDTNVRRVLARWREGAALPAPHLSRAEVARATEVVPLDSARAARWAAASMELGALVCTARSPQCAHCPVRAMCAWRAAGYPADPRAGSRRRQAFDGTDRQLRGRVIRVLRQAHTAGEAAGWVSLSELLLLAEARQDAARAQRILDGLHTDGLIEVDGRAGYARLPQR